MLYESSLLRRLRAGDRAAFEAVVARHYESVYRQLWYLCGDRDTAAGLTQETFVRAWESLPTYAGRAAMRTWLHTVAVRVWHRSTAEDRLHLRANLLPLDCAAEQIDDLRFGPTARMETDAVWESLVDALRDLPAPYREAVRLYCVEEMRYREIAETLGIPIGTVKSRLQAGLRRLRAYLIPHNAIELTEGKKPRQ